MWHFRRKKNFEHWVLLSKVTRQDYVTLGRSIVALFMSQHRFEQIHNNWALIFAALFPYVQYLLVKLASTWEPTLKGCEGKKGLTEAFFET